MAEWWQENSTPIKTEDSSQEDSLQDLVTEANVGKFDKEEEDDWWKTNATPIETPDPVRPDYGLGELASTSLERGFRQTGSLVGDVIPALALSAFGFDEAAERQMEEARATQEYVQRNLPAQFPSFRDVQWTNPLDVGKFVVEAMGENATNLIPVLGLGATGTKVGANIASKKAFENLVDKKVSQKVKDRITSAAARKGADIGQVGGVFLGSYSLNVPETFRGIYEETGTFEPGAALLAGVVNASLDSIFPVTLLRGFSQPARAGIVSKVLQRSGMNPSLANNAVTRIFGAAALEGVTEGSQEAVNITTENFVQDHSFVFDSKDYDRVLEGAVKGAAAGGGYRATGEAVNKVREEVSKFNAKKGSDPTPPTTTTTDEDAKVREAQRLDELAAAERVAREGEQKRLQQELDEKILTEQGVDEVLTDMNKYFSGNNQSEINVIRNNLRKLKAQLKKNRPERDPIILGDLLNKVTEKVKVEQPKTSTKDDALEQSILSFAKEKGIISINATSKEIKAGAKKTEVLLDKLVKSGQLNLNVEAGKRVYTVPGYVKPEAKPKEIKTYGTIPAAKPKAVGYKLGKSDNAKRTATTDEMLKDIITLAGIPFISTIARSEFRDFDNITPNTMDANLQKRIINELNTYAEDMYYNQEDADGNRINRKESRESVFRKVEATNDINELENDGVLSKETVEALKEYAQEVNNDINTRESRERDRGATTATEQEGLRTSPTAPVQAAKESATEVVDEADTDAVATTGPDTRQFTGRERRVDSALKTNDRGIILDDEGKPKVFYHGTSKSFEEFKTPEEGLLGVEAVFVSESSDLATRFTGAKSEEELTMGDFQVIPVNVRTKNLFDFRNKEHIDKVAEIIETQELDTVPGLVERDGKAIFISPLEEFKESQVDGDFAKIEPFLNEIQEAGFDAFLVREIPDDSVSLNVGVFDPSQLVSTSTKKFTGKQRGDYPELNGKFVEVIKPDGTSVKGRYEIIDSLPVVELDSIGRIKRRKRKRQKVKPVGIINYEQIKENIKLEEGENLNYKLGEFGDVVDRLRNKYGEDVIVNRREYLKRNDQVIPLYNVDTGIETPVSISPPTHKSGKQAIRDGAPISTDQIKNIRREMNRRAKLKRKPKKYLIFELDDSKVDTLKTTRKGDPRDKEIINKLKSKRTLGQVLAILDKENITTTQKELVTVLLSLPNIKSVKFNIVKDSDLDPGTFGEYNVKDNFIKVGVSGDVEAILHEATHAATANQLTKHISRDGRSKTRVGERLLDLYNTTIEELTNQDLVNNRDFIKEFKNELENIDEFVAGAFNNPNFQLILAQIESPRSKASEISAMRTIAADRKGKDATTREINQMEATFRGPPLEETIESAWTEFVKTVKQMISNIAAKASTGFDINIRDSVLNDVIALAPELFVGPNPAEQARGPQGVLFKKGEESKTISEENVKSFDFKVKLAEPTISSDPNQINESDVDTTETEKALSSEQALLNQATGPNIVTDEEAAARAKNDVDITKNAEFYSGDAVELLASEESYFTKQFNVVADIIQGLPIAQSGLGETIANKFSNIPAGLARVYAGFISIGQSEELYGVRLPGLGVLKRLIEQKATITKSGFEEISYVVQYVEDILNKYNTTPEGRATVKEWNDVIFKLSGKDTDPEVMINEPNAEHVPSRKKLEDGTFETTTNQEFLNANPEIAALVTRYNALPEDLKAAARRMVEDLRTKYTRLLEATIADNPQNESEIRARFTMRPYYIPFIRRGDYWFSYMDTETGKKGYGSAASPSARRAEMQRIQDSGIGTDVKISNKADVASAGLGPDRNIDAFVQNIQDSFKNLDFSGIPDAQQAGIKEALTKTLKENYLALFPDQSLRAQQTHRAQVPGYIEDVLLSYSDVAPKITSSLSNTMHNRQIIEQINAIQIQANREENRNNNIIQGVAASALKRTSFFLNPIAESWAALAAYGSYYWFLGMNPSSAIINYTQLPLVVMPFLSAEYGGATGGGIARAYKAMHEAHRLYFRQGGREQSKSFGNDYTMAPFKVDYATGEKTYTGKEAEDFAPKGAKIEITQRDGKVIKKIAKKDGKYYALFDAAESSQTVRRGISYEATELSRQTGASFEKPNRLGGKIDTLVGWMFQNSERLNREVTLVAAFNLEMDKLKKDNSPLSPKEREQRAIAKAIDLTVRAHSHALPEAGPEFFQNGLPKVMTIFKRFAQQQVYLVAKLFQTVLPKSGDYVDPNTGKKLKGKALDNYKKERRIAAERLIGIYAASIALAGIQGAPLYGLVKILAELIMDDEDEPFDLDVVVAQQFGNTLYGGPVNKVLGIDMSRRTGFRDMLFREDPQRLEELGFVLYSLETLGGPAISIATRTTDGLTELFGDEGFNVRSTEKLLPTSLGNVLKAYRQANEGVLNKRGVPIADDPNLWQTGKQIFGFTSQEVSLAYRKANALKGPERKLYQRRSRLLLEYWLALRSGDTDGLLDVKEEITEYNSKVPRGFRISNETISRSMSNRRKLERRAFNGVDVKNRAELEEIYGIPDD